MSDVTPTPLPGTPATVPGALVSPVPVVTRTVDPAKAFAALGNPWRWAMFKLLRQRGAMSASQVAALLKRDFDGVSKHLRVMRAAGVLASKRGEEDARLELYYIPGSVLRADGVVDMGFCAIRAE
jgi:DNA-binding transcriptional ArsR family regulator